MVALLLAVGPVGCAPAPADDDGRPLVVATIHPVGDLLRTVAGEHVRVEVLLPTRASPTTWEATPSQLRLVARADGYVTVGAGLDGWLEGMGALPPGARTLRLTDGVELDADDHDHGHGVGTGDPHVWLDPVLVRDHVVPALVRFASALVPEAAREVEARAVALSDSLTVLDAAIRAALDDAPRRGYVATHGAWGYFARRYGLEPLGSVYERPGHEPSAAGLAALVRRARAAGLDAVLAEPQLAGSVAVALAEELGARVVVVDPLGGPELPGRRRYLDMMRFNAGAFADALGAR